MTSMKQSELDETTLNGLVAKHIMGLDPECSGPLRRTEGDARYEQYRCRECGQPIAFTTEYFAQHGELPKSHPRNVPNYRKDMNAAWSVVEKITEPPTTLDSSHAMPRNTRFAFWFEKANLWSLSAEEAARAICIKALEICGVVEP